MLTECVKCGFYVKQNDEFCLNCGIESPGIEFNKPSDSTLPLYNLIRSGFVKIICSLIFTIILVFAAADWSFSNLAYLRDSYFFLVLFFGLSASFSTLFLLEKWYFKRLNIKRLKNTENFLSKLKLIDNRLSDLDRREKQIDLILYRINENPGRQLTDVKPKLIKAREIVISQFARYELQKQKIELVRLQNGVSPYLVGWNQLNEYEIENGLVTIKNTKQEINKVRQKLANYTEVGFPEKFLSEKHNFLSQLDETEMSFEQLREALLSRQAIRALREVSPVEENLNLPNADNIIHAAETFNIQTTLTDFSESFDELEREYQRLKAEENIEQKLLKS